MTATRTRPLRRVLPLLLAAAALALPACSSDSDSPAGSTGNPTAPDLGAAGDKVAGGEGKRIDACALLEPGEIKALLPGAPAQGEEQGTGYCTWEDPTTYNSVSIRVGSAGLVTDGKLPEPEGPDAGYEDGPDGIRFSMGGTVAEFVAGDRACDVQIAVGKDVKAQLVTLVGKLKPRITA